MLLANFPDKHGNSPLILAAFSGSVDVLRFAHAAAAAAAAAAAPVSAGTLSGQ